jgi:energy-coupling factor transporter transmembrane protein EcfT
VSQDSTDKVKQTQKDHPGLLWVAFFSASLVYLSLWLVEYAAWHISIFILTICLLGLRSKNPLRQFAFLLGIISFLFLLQISFSPFMQERFLNSLETGFSWSDWRYLLVAIERFTLPLALVASFQRELAKPEIITRLTMLLMPLQWMGIKIQKLQMLLVLSLKFMPGLRREWERFDQLQTYFVAKLPKRSLMQRLSYWQGVLKAMIAHTLQQAVKTGDLLALRGMPEAQTRTDGQIGLRASVLWLLAGLGSGWLDRDLLVAWSLSTVWLFLTFLSNRKGRAA